MCLFNLFEGVFATGDLEFFEEGLSLPCLVLRPGKGECRMCGCTWSITTVGDKPTFCHLHDIQAVITYVRIKQTNNIYAPITFYLQKHLMGRLNFIYENTFQMGWQMSRSKYKRFLECVG